jgi:hypothetical protein
MSKKAVEAEQIVKSNLGATTRDKPTKSNPDAVFQSATNVHEKIVALGAIPNLTQLKKDIEKIRKPRDLPTLVQKERVENAIPFSMIEFKRKIGA